MQWGGVSHDRFKKIYFFAPPCLECRGTVYHIFFMRSPFPVWQNAGMTSDPRWVWVAATEVGSEGSWQWSDGSSFSTTFNPPWQPTKPRTNTQLNTGIVNSLGMKDVGVNFVNDLAPQGYWCSIPSTFI